jgi:hypothetical protein
VQRARERDRLGVVAADRARIGHRARRVAERGAAHSAEPTVPG